MTPSQLQRFEAKVMPEPMSGCWLWVASTNRCGYGQINMGLRPELAHRVSYEHHVGPIADGLHVLHSCDTPACCNPEHLFLGTHMDNMADMAAKLRARGGDFQAAKTSCPQGHPYQGANLYVVPKTGKRHCRTCSKARDAKRRQQQRDWKTSQGETDR